MLVCIVCVHICWASELGLFDLIVGGVYTHVGCSGVGCVVDGFAGEQVNGAARVDEG